MDKMQISQVFLHFIVSYNMAIYPRDIEEFQKIRSSSINCYVKINIKNKRRNGMEFKQIETVTIQILQDAQGSFLFPYQIFNRIKRENTALGEQIENAYPAEPDKPIMGEGAGIYYSAASFVAHALNKFKDSHSKIKKEWFDAKDIEVEGIIPGNKEGTSIWAWKEEEV